MLLFDTQVQKQPVQIKEAPKEGSFAAVIQEAIKIIANGGERSQKENKQTDFLMSSKDEPAQKNMPAGSSLKGRLGMDSVEFRSIDPAAAELYAQQTAKEVEKLLGQPPTAAEKDRLQATIDAQNYEKKFLQKYLELMSDTDRLDKWRMKKAEDSRRFV